MKVTSEGLGENAKKLFMAYMLTQEASSSLGLQKCTFVTPIGIKWKERKKELSTISYFDVAE